MPESIFTAHNQGMSIADHYSESYRVVKPTNASMADIPREVATRPRKVATSLKGTEGKGDETMDKHVNQKTNIRNLFLVSGNVSKCQTHEEFHCGI